MHKVLVSIIRLGIPRHKTFWLGLLVAVLQSLSALALMATSAWLISRAAEQPPVMYLMIAVVGVRAFALGRAFFRYVERLLLHDAAFRMLADLRPRVFAKLIPFAPAGMGSNRADTVTRLINDVDETQNLSLRVLAPTLQALVTSGAAVGFLWVLVPNAGIALAVCILAAVFIGLPLSSALATRANRATASDRSALNQGAAVVLENLELLESYGWLEHYRADLEVSQQKLTRGARRLALSAGIGQSLFLLEATLATGSTSYIASLEVSSGRLAGVMLAVFALVPMAVFDSLTNLQPVVGVWQRYRASSSRVADLLDAEPDHSIAEPNEGVELDSFSALQFVNVSATYPSAEYPSVQDVTFDVLPGENMLIQGPSGYGKSTIANVMAGFLNPSSGSYRINGLDRVEVKTTSLRKLVGYQEQTPTIFSGSLRANLALAKPNANDEELWALLDRVRLASTFKDREGLDTQLGEFGHKISGGEAQRIALARSLLADFKVIVFDEPTANVDDETSAQLIDDMLAIAKNDKTRACIFISHDDGLLGNSVDKRISL